LSGGRKVQKIFKRKKEKITLIKKIMKLQPIRGLMTVGLTVPIFMLSACCHMHQCSMNKNGSGAMSSSDGMTNSPMNNPSMTNNWNSMTNSDSGMTNSEGSMTNSGMTDADNSQKNMRDRSGANLTPMDQGNSPNDRDTTQQIRKMVVSSTNNYSMMAQNVKIITVNGKVTLRGPVKTDEEKSGIETIAKNVAGEGNVDDQIEVKANP
jgi:hyperosmotically inducible protein